MECNPDSYRDKTCLRTETCVRVEDDMIQQGHIAPPQWPLNFLDSLLRKRYIEEIEGDMEELFFDNVERLSYGNAKRIYTWEALKLLRPILMQNFEGLERLNQYAMFKNYFKVSVRGLMKNPLNSFINVFGLSAAIGVCVFAYGFAQWTFSRDQFHKNKTKYSSPLFSPIAMAACNNTELLQGHLPKY